MTEARAGRQGPPRLPFLAIQLLALGDAPEHVAYQTGLTPEELRRHLEDPDARAAVAAEAALLGLDEAAWEQRLARLMRQATARALTEGRVGTLNLLLRQRQAPPPARRRAPDDDDAAGDDEDGKPDEDAWIESLPVVEPEPAREAERRSLLRRIEPPVLRRAVGHAPLEGIEQYLVAGDPAGYEAWFARQPKPPCTPVRLDEADRAAIAHVTRHNPPWIKGQYLGFYREPVPAHLFEPQAALPYAPEPAAAVEPAADATPTVEDLRDRVARLLDRTLPRLTEELDLAEAICALRWPKWPNYQGAIDLDLLTEALRSVPIDAKTLSWLGSTELAAACRAAKPP